MGRTQIQFTGDRTQDVKLLARGPCGASQRSVTADIVLVRFVPTIGGHEIDDPAMPEGGCGQRSEAVAAARRFQSQCQNDFAETNGSM